MIIPYVLQILECKIYKQFIQLKVSFVAENKISCPIRHGFHSFQNCYDIIY